MEKIYAIKKLKKYLFFISVVFLFLSLSHLIYNYIYYDSKEIAQKGGTISESFVGDFPDLNPLKYQNNDHNSYINHILYRSLLTYDIAQGKIVGDLTRCDIGDLSRIECFLDNNVKWSSGDDIEIEDIVATYDILKQTDANPIMKSILEKVEIIPKKSSIIFQTKGNDVNILNIFFQKILPKNVVEQIDIENINGNFSPINGIYSGKYKISKVDSDDTVGFRKIFLEKNEFYSRNPVYIENIILKFYKDYTTLLQQKDSINIFGDKKNLIGNSIPKLKKYSYILPQYVGIFINKDKVKYPNIRNYILEKINREDVLKKIGENSYKSIKSPFLNEVELDTFLGKSSIDEMMNSIGYYKKDYYLKGLVDLDKDINTYSDEVEIKKDEDILEINITEIKNSITKDNYNSKSKIILSPDWVDKYNYITNPTITLEGETNKNVSLVYINDYKLTRYSPLVGKFYYKISPGIGNIKVGENKYDIYFVENGRKSLKESINIFYNKDRQTLEKWEADLVARLVEEKIEEEKELLELKKAQVKKENEVVINQENLIKKNLISELDDRFYYNKDFSPYSLNLSYISGNKQAEDVASMISNVLEESGIKVEILAETLLNITKKVGNDEENYDMLLAGINLGYFNFNISKYFYSGQIREGKNLSKIKNSDLDNILEDLKSSLLTKDKMIELQKAIVGVLQKEAVFKPLYSPYYSNLVIKNIEGYELEELIPSDSYRFDPLSKSYILKEKIVDKDTKSFLGFFKFLVGNLF